MTQPPKKIRLGNVPLEPEERTTLEWLRRQPWEPGFADYYHINVPDSHHTAHVGAFAGGSYGPIVDLLKYLEEQGVIGAQEPHPVKGMKAPYSLHMKADDLAALGITPKQERKRDKA